jgi:hypothetical protein
MSAAGSSRRLTRAAALEETQAASPSSIDPAAAMAETKSKLSLGTAKGMLLGTGSSLVRSAAPASGAGASSSKLPIAAALPQAKRLETANPLAEIATAANEAADDSAAARKGVTEEQLAAYRSRKKIPPWAWWAIAGGGLLVVVVLAFLFRIF